MEISVSADSSSADSDSLKEQNATLHKENAVSNKTNDVLLKSLKQLVGKVKKLKCVNLDQAECTLCNNKELIKELLAENEKVEKMFLNDSTSDQKLAIVEECTENIAQEESLESVGKEKLAIAEERTENIAQDDSLESVGKEKLAIAEERTENIAQEESLESVGKEKLAVAEECTENIAQEESLESVGQEKLEVTGEVGRVGSESSEQLTNVKELKREQYAKIAQLKQVTNDKSHQNMAIMNKENTLNLEKEINRQLEQNKKASADFRADVEEMESALNECQKGLGDLRTLNSELQTQLEIANEKVEKTKKSLKTVEIELRERGLKTKTLQEENESLLESIKVLEAAEDADEVLEMDNAN